MPLESILYDEPAFARNRSLSSYGRAKYSMLTGLEPPLSGINEVL